MELGAMWRPWDLPVRFSGAGDLWNELRFEPSMDRHSTASAVMDHVNLPMGASSDLQWQHCEFATDSLVEQSSEVEQTVRPAIAATQRRNGREQRREGTERRQWGNPESA
jgi:hypothetical protein